MNFSTIYEHKSLFMSVLNYTSLHTLDKSFESRLSIRELTDFTPCKKKQEKKSSAIAPLLQQPYNQNQLYFFWPN